MPAPAVQDDGRRVHRRGADQMPALPRLQPSEAREPTPAAARPRWKGSLVWLFVPPEDMKTFAASAFAPVSEASISACISQNPDIELCAMSSETVSPHPLSWRGWQTRPWLRLLSGTICDPSTAAHGVAAFISSLPDIPASPSASRGCVKGRMTPGTSGPRSPGSSVRSRRNCASSRTSPAICPLVSTMSPESFRAWATGLQRASYQRRKSGHRTSGSGCSFWPTPTFRSAGNRAAVHLTPEQGLSFRNDLNQAGSQIGLRNAATSWSLMWDLMISAGWNPQNPVSSPRYRVVLLNGEKHSEGALGLNPAFCDWMMGWPPGWTEPLLPVMGWSLWLRRARGAI